LRRGCRLAWLGLAPPVARRVPPCRLSCSSASPVSTSLLPLSSDLPPSSSRAAYTSPDGDVALCLAAIAICRAMDNVPAPVCVLLLLCLSWPLLLWPCLCLCCYDTCANALLLCSCTCNSLSCGASILAHEYSVILIACHVAPIVAICAMPLMCAHFLAPGLIIMHNPCILQVPVLLVCYPLCYYSQKCPVEHDCY
jgi:hypothetical protein